MIRCSRCVIPDSRPDTKFVDGICSACRSFDARPYIDWGTRRRALEALLECGRNTSGYDCIVPSSGGKDSTYQVLKLIELGAKPLVVTASTCHLTKIGRMNIDNLARHATTVEITPNRTVRAKLNRIGLEMVGDISWPEHAGIFTTPFRIAADLGIPLIFYGENPQNQYGGPQGSEEARLMTARWVHEFGGFLGLRPADCVGIDGITERDMLDYMMPQGGTALDENGDRVVEAHFLGQYLPWDSHENAKAAHAAGMVQVLPSSANWWHHENLDNAQTGLHDHGMYRKYGYGRMAAQVSVDIRTGLIKREHGLEMVRALDGTFPEVYMGVEIEDMLKRIGLTRVRLMETLEKFTNWSLFSNNTKAERPILKETA